ncbi:hypothetical protein GCM10023091_18430 [Ravibacter arvi]|uniref:Ankyrin repeat domain-containing protein n=1 Tax=Ravibacter arvi TaxID=2051041 RepID=A0ABP8LXF6_9BACT
MQARICALLDEKDFQGLDQYLGENPGLANQGIPFDNVNTTLAHPLHRLCDRVFSGAYTEVEALRMAMILVNHGADINGNVGEEGQDSPLTAAASLHADEMALFYIEKGADIHHKGCYGGTALHWASWCGRPVVVERLVKAGAFLNARCTQFKATPLHWAINGLGRAEKNGRTGHLSCLRLLIRAGADTAIPDGEGKTFSELLTSIDPGELSL